MRKWSESGKKLFQYLHESFVFRLLFPRSSGDFNDCPFLYSLALHQNG